MAAIGYMYGKCSRADAARSVLGEFEELRRQGRYVSGCALGAIYAGLGDREHAFSSLDAALRERSHWLVWLKRDPRWNDISLRCPLPRAGTKDWFAR